METESKGRRTRELNVRALWTLADGSEHFATRASLPEAMAAIPFGAMPTDWVVVQLDRSDYAGAGRVLAGCYDAFIPANRT